MKTRSRWVTALLSGTLAASLTGITAEAQVEEASEGTEAAAQAAPEESQDISDPILAELAEQIKASLATFHGRTFELGCGDSFYLYNRGCLLYPGKAYVLAPRIDAILVTVVERVDFALASGDVKAAKSMLKTFKREFLRPWAHVDIGPRQTARFYKTKMVDTAVRAALKLIESYEDNIRQEKRRRSRV